jgi:hypothetical protein
MTSTRAREEHTIFFERIIQYARARTLALSVHVQYAARSLLVYSSILKIKVVISG